LPIFTVTISKAGSTARLHVIAPTPEAAADNALTQGDDMDFPWDKEPADPIAVTEVIAIQQIA
jgi:hypothetical protein